MADGPYKLPEGWRWVRLGEVTRREAFIIQPSENPSLLFNYIGLEHLDAGRWEEPEENWVYGAEIKSACVHFKQGYVLYAKLRPYLNKVVVCSREGIASTEFVPMIVHPRLLTPKYLGAYLRSPIFVTYASHNTTGSRMPRVRMEALWNAPIPLPPLEEQRRIVAKVEALMARVREARRLRAEAKKDAEHLMQAALAEVFPRPGAALPQGWRWVRLGEVFQIQQGASMSPKRRRGVNPRPFLRTKNIQWGFVDLSDVDEMDFTDKEVNTLALQEGDLLVCEGGDVGRTAIWQGELPLCLYQNHIHRLRAIGDVEPKFYMYWMQVAYQIFSVYAGEESKTAIPNLSGRRLREFIAPLSPLDEQRRIVAYLDQIQQQATALKRAHAETETELKHLEQAILDRAFRGEL